MLVSDEDLKSEPKNLRIDIIKFINHLLVQRIINNKNKWCIWLHDEKSDWRSNKYLKKIVEKVYEHRINSKRSATKN